MSEVKTERRSAPRAVVDLPLQISPPAGARQARLRDLSASGLCCLFGEPIAEMTLMGVDLDLPGSGQHHVEGVVVRCDKRRGQSPPTYEIAIYFRELSPETRQAITRFVLARLSVATTARRRS